MLSMAQCCWFCRKKTPGGKNAVHYQSKIGSRVVRVTAFLLSRFELSLPRAPFSPSARKPVPARV